MVKAVAIPTYLLSFFLLMIYITKALESATRSFSWSGSIARKMTWILWNELCESKGKGGLGFRDIHCFNLALLAKQGCRLLTNPSSLLHQILQATLLSLGGLPDCPPWLSPLGYVAKYISSSILFEKGLRYRVCNGASRSIWTDPWLQMMGISDLTRLDHPKEWARKL